MRRSELSAVQHGNANESPVLSGQPHRVNSRDSPTSRVPSTCSASSDEHLVHGFSDPIATMGRQLIRLLPRCNRRHDGSQAQDSQQLGRSVWPERAGLGAVGGDAGGHEPRDSVDGMTSAGTSSTTLKGSCGHYMRTARHCANQKQAGVSCRQPNATAAAAAESSGTRRVVRV